MVFATLFHPAGEKLGEGMKPHSKRKKRQKTETNDDSLASSLTEANQINTVRKEEAICRPSRISTGPPSRAAIELSAKLKDCSINKRLQDALDLYWDKSNHLIRDSHHACIVVDCSARCGAIHEGEKIVEEMIHAGVTVNIETNTALLKGYAHAGMMHQGAALFQSMSKGTGRQRPNVRTLNTLLRGCLWTAATVRNTKHIAGGVVTARDAWLISGEFDASSYEYYIAVLCYALQTEDAQSNINHFQQQHNITSTRKRGEISHFYAEDPTHLETLAISLLNLSRAHAVLGQSTNAISSARLALCAADSILTGSSNKNKQQPLTAPGKVNGGKRAWRQDTTGSRRSESNTLFRTHRISEIKSEAKWILDVTSNRIDEPGRFTKSIATRLFAFSGGGTTGLMSTNAKPEKANQTDVLNTSWLSFGLMESARATSLIPAMDLANNNDILDTSSCKTLLEITEVGNNPILDKKGFLHFPVIFKDAPRNLKEGLPKRRKLNVELGAGFGDWIAEQAKLNPNDNYVAVEMRSDRVAQTFAKAVLSIPELKNLCCVGAEGGSFLRESLRPASVSTIFVNHPEPPTQTFGSQDDVLTSIANGGEEPAHMLTSSTLTNALTCLEVTGRLVIVTDNRFYGRLICATMVKALSTMTSGECRSVALVGFSEVERYGTLDNTVHLYEGLPSLEIGHFVDGKGVGGGTSYFDRLWRTGAGNHAEKSKRFIVTVERQKSQQSVTAEQPLKKNKKRKFRIRGEQVS